VGVGVSVAPPQGEQTRDRILRLADDLFADHGYARVSMRIVAGAAGVTKPALYYHFRDKEALYEECVSASQRRVGTLLRESAGGEGPLPERLLAATLTLLTESRHHPIRTQSDIAEHLPTEARHRLNEGFHESVMRPLCDLFQAAAERGELRDGVTVPVAAAALLGLVMPFLAAASHGEDPAWGPQRPGVDGSADSGRAAQLIAGLALRGIAAN
jgi:AcrR family transcriptional regulator